MWLKIKQEGQTAGFGPCFHLPGFHVGTGFLSRSVSGSSGRWMGNLLPAERPGTSASLSVMAVHRVYRQGFVEVHRFRGVQPWVRAFLHSGSSGTSAWWITFRMIIRTRKHTKHHISHATYALPDMFFERLRLEDAAYRETLKPEPPCFRSTWFAFAGLLGELCWICRTKGLNNMQACDACAIGDTSVDNMLPTSLTVLSCTLRGY